MPSTRDIRRRIKSVKSTAQITKAMQMVASSKMQKAQQGALNFRPFAAMASELIHLWPRTLGHYRSHPLMETARGAQARGGSSSAPTKGLCGALNSNLFREAVQVRHARPPMFIAVGQEGRAVPRPHPAQAGGRVHLPRHADLSPSAQAISKFAQRDVPRRAKPMPWTSSSRASSTRSRSSPMRAALLPIGSAERLVTEARSRRRRRRRSPRIDFLFEPDPGDGDGPAGASLPGFSGVRRCLLEAKASEHSARMVAMKNATDNANQLVKDLTLEYNKLRQANITKELLEISSAPMALG